MKVIQRKSKGVFDLFEADSSNATKPEVVDDDDNDDDVVVLDDIIPIVDEDAQLNRCSLLERTTNEIDHKEKDEEDATVAAPFNKSLYAGIAPMTSGSTTPKGARSRIMWLPSREEEVKQQHINNRHPETEQPTEDETKHAAYPQNDDLPLIASPRHAAAARDRVVTTTTTTTTSSRCIASTTNPYQQGSNLSNLFTVEVERDQENHPSATTFLGCGPCFSAY